MGSWTLTTEPGTDRAVNCKNKIKIQSGV